MKYEAIEIRFVIQVTTANGVDTFVVTWTAAYYGGYRVIVSWKGVDHICDSDDKPDFANSCLHVYRVWHG
jgi:hypothetical protein